MRVQPYAGRIRSDVHFQIFRIAPNVPADEMSPDALKDEPFWAHLAEILREIAPLDEELDTIRKRLVAQLNRVQSTHCPQGGALDHQSIEE
jgi:hypothetical protein